MSIRKKLNENPAIVTAVVSLLVVVAVGVVILQVLSGRRGYVGSVPLYFTVDDGQTWFVADSGNIPPFEHEGQTAVRAHVFECDGEQFVGYVERYKPEARRVLVADQERRAAQSATGQGSGGGMPANLGQIQAAQIGGREIKKPGQTEWVSSGDFERASAITNIPCPQDPIGLAKPLVP